MGICPICSNHAEINTNGNLLLCVCKVCGRFLFTREVQNIFINSSFPHHLDAPKISAYIRNKSLFNPYEVVVYTDKVIDCGITLSFEDIINDFPKTITARIDSTLINLSKLSNFSGDFIEISQFDYPLFYADSKNINSFFFIMQQLYHDNYIESNNGSTNPGVPSKLRLTAKGWNRIIELERGKSSITNKVFIAMWFNPSLTKAYLLGIEKAIRDAGYDPIRVDFEEHNDKICDRIIADIRKCKFVICDFTGHRGGVYFEAGFAMGLGKPVIWTCREDDLTNIHFDTRQYNHISWSDETDLYEKLLRRIQATI